MGKPFKDREINIYTCLTNPAKPCVALIDGFPMIFEAPTPLKARKLAEDWRTEAIRQDKLRPARRKKADAQ